MTIIHTTAIIISAIVLFVTAYGFLGKKWNFWLSMALCWFSVSLFGFGILPTQFPAWSLSRQVIFTILVSIANFIVTGSLLKYIVAQKGK